MKIQRAENCGEIRTVLADDVGPLEIIIWRDLVLNYGDVVSAHMTAFHPGLHGYFATTDRGDVFIPTDQPLTEGQTVQVQVTKEARMDKVATAHIITTPMTPEPQPAETLPAAEMDALIDEAMAPDIPFGKGAMLHIERTKVCWTIDVDTGSSTETQAHTNQQAIPVIARQIRLKNMGGLILIDFAGSKRGPHRTEWKQALKQALAEDSRSRVLGWTDSGLFEIERRRDRADLWTTCAPDNPINTYYQVLRALASTSLGHPTVYVAPEVFQLLNRYSVRAKLKPVPGQPISYFEIKES